MSFAKLPRAEARPGDPPAMIQAISALHGADARRPSLYQLKLPGGINFWPAKGTIFIDGEPGPHPHRGLEALLKLVTEQNTAS